MPITSESRKEIPSRGLGKKNYIIKALEKRGLSQEDFWDTVIDRSMGEEGNVQLIQLVGQRLEAPFKPTMPPVDLGIEQGDSLDVMADKVMAAGLPPDVTEKMLSAIKMRHEISEKGELLKRMEGIEQRLRDGPVASTASTAPASDTETTDGFSTP